MAVTGNENFVPGLHRADMVAKMQQVEPLTERKDAPAPYNAAKSACSRANTRWGVQVIVAVYFRNINFRTRQTKIRVALVSGHMERIAL